MDCNNRSKVDLHIHSTASDGSMTPGDILKLALEKGLAAISLTDHDTVAGVQQIISVSNATPLKFVSGIEISAAMPDETGYQGSIHILGYGIDPFNPDLLAAVKRLEQARRQRIPRIIEKLQQAGIDLDPARVEEHIGTGTAGRPHVAKALVEMGIVRNVDQAFDLWLAKGRPGYVDKFRLPARQAIKAIGTAGGLAVLAHPFLIFNAVDNRLTALVNRLGQMGLAGLEAYYPKHSPETVSALLAMAADQGFLVTGGTDFHGAINPQIELGTGQGDFHVPWQVYLELERRLEELNRKQS